MARERSRKPIDLKALPPIVDEKFLRSFIDQRCPTMAARRRHEGFNAPKASPEELRDFYSVGQRIFDHKFPGVRSKLVRIFARLDEIMEMVAEVFPQANYYAEAESFNLMIGDSHDHMGRHSQQELCGVHVDYPFDRGRWDCGAW